MRLNKYLASATGMSRRAADAAVASGYVAVNGQTAVLGQEVTAGDTVTLRGERLAPPQATVTILLHKPAGYVCSRNGQGSPTIYELLPRAYHHLKPVGRLDKDSSGLLLLTNDGDLAHQLTHPRFQKTKIYHVGLHKPLAQKHQQQITTTGVLLADGPSSFKLTPNDHDRSSWKITMQEGRNRQIRRTFAAVGYDVLILHRSRFGRFGLEGLGKGEWRLS